MRLSPLQEAWGAYVHHSLRQCPVCRRADGSPCETAEELYRAYREVGKQVTEKVWGTGGGATLPPGQ
ncbi:hypothetical protein [Streptomyces sp. NPDC085937]|uniref:hypothetical protein n=1 Tax=Streptomyces sp. NPDC085937 TaxID=3365742 RepID=UPI0037D265FD